LLGLVLLAIATTVLIVVLNNYQLNKRLKEIDNQNLIIYNFLNSSNFFRNNESESIYKAILSKLEIKNLSILILDNEGNVVIDTKGYDVASGGITPSPLIEIEELGKNSNDNEILNLNKKSASFRDFLNNEIFIEKYNNSKKGIKSSFSVQQENKKLELFSILPVSLNDDVFHIVAYEDNTEIQRINNQIRFNVLLAGLAIAFSLILFSFFLNFIILKPIKKLAKAAENVDADVKSKPLITVLDRREDEIGQLSKIINTMLKNLYQKIDNAENNSADLMHEIRNPLASIRMATDVINDKLDDEQKKFLDLILNDISRIENIITDYSSMIKDEVNLYKSQSNVFNIRELLDELIHNYKENVSNKLNIKFFANENQNLLVNGQKSFLYQAFDNIIMNAASFSPSDGIIEIVLSSTENYLSVSISDEGPGIKDPNIKRIFDRFYSFRDNKSDQGHSGLGLSIAKQIIDAHDGYISADNVIEGGNIMGAKFIVNLPLAD
tara:strand:- start:267 stop:1751 length:1485 start_codon:yes stop_codon:yes gene_type:complete